MTVPLEITQKTDTGRAAVAPKYKLSVSRHFTPVCWCPGSVHWWMAQMRAGPDPWCRGGVAGWISGPLMDIIICKIFATKLHCVHPSSLDLSAVSVKIPAAAARGRPVPGSGSGPGALQLQLWSRPPEETGTRKKAFISCTNQQMQVLEQKGTF